MEKQGGFTLLELITVLGVMVILLGLALPSMSSWRKESAYRSAARQIVSAMRLARSHAISRTREVELDFDLDTQCYRMRLGNQAYASDTWTELTSWRGLPEQIRLATTKDCDKLGTCGVFGTMSGNYICVLSPDLKPKYAGAVLSYTTGRALVKTWDETARVWRE